MPSGDTSGHICENGRLVRAEDPEAPTHYYYQHGDQLARVERCAEKAHYGYGYNTDFQIDSLSYAGASTSGGYDDDGLITAINGFHLTYNAQSGDLEELKGGDLTQTWQWNGYGEATAVDYYQSGHNTYVYGSQGQLLQVDTPDESIEYRHNALGQRVAKLIDGEIVERYLWQDLATYDGSGNLKQRFEYTVRYTPTSFTQSGQRYYIQTDHLGSPRAVTDSSGSIVKAIRYDSYGNVTDNINPEFDIPFGFSRGLRDSDTGLVRF